MKLSNLLSTLDSQIPIAAVDVLSPDEATIIQWLATEAQQKLDTPVFFWNLGVSSLEQCLIAPDGGLVFRPVAEYKRPPQADPLLFVFDYIANFSGNGVFILGDIHPFIAKNSPQLSWEILSKVKNLYHRLKPTDKQIEKALSGTGDTSGVSQRILGNILTFMSESQCGVFVVATCNDPSALPSELKRKGRFDENFFVDLPTEPERVQILGIHLESE